MNLGESATTAPQTDTNLNSVTIRGGHPLAYGVAHLLSPDAERAFGTAAGNRCVVAHRVAALLRQLLHPEASRPSQTICCQADGQRRCDGITTRDLAECIVTLPASGQISDIGGAERFAVSLPPEFS